MLKYGMEPTRQLIDHLHRERVERARRSTASERMLQGAQLFDYGVETMLAGLRARHPGASPDELLQRVRLMLATQKQRQR